MQFVLSDVGEGSFELFFCRLDLGHIYPYEAGTTRRLGRFLPVDPESLLMSAHTPLIYVLVLIGKATDCAECEGTLLAEDWGLLEMLSRRCSRPSFCDSIIPETRKRRLSSSA